MGVAGRGRDGEVMHPEPRRTPDPPTGDDPIGAIPHRMIEAWNRGDAAAFAHACTARTDFLAFEGTHLVGRDEIVAFHRPLFETVLAGSRLQGGTRFVRRLDVDTAIVHARAEVVLPGHDQPSPGRTSMQLFVVRREGPDWMIEAVQNCRLVTLERQLLLDELDELPDTVHDVLAASRKRARRVAPDGR
jgi:uncharacterized protein (TIGR02246 family)